MSRRITTLSPVEIRERAHFDLVKSEIDQRKRAGFGYRADSLDLARLPGVMEAFSFPGVHIGGTPSQWGIYMQGAYGIPSRKTGSISLSCSPSILIDGMKADIQYLRDLSKDEIAMIEVFNSAARAPAQFGGGSNCGIVMVWRKLYVNPP
jgi:hypothetical protein